MLAIDCEAEPLRIRLCTLPDVDGDGACVRFSVGVEAVEAVGEPILGAVVEHNDGREQVSGPDVLGVLANGLLVERSPGLRAAVGADPLQLEAITIDGQWAVFGFWRQVPVG